jgi:hypothetical protein
MFRSQPDQISVSLKAIRHRKSNVASPDYDPDPDADPALFVTDLQDANKKLIFLNKFFCLFYYLLFEGTFTSFFKDKKVKKKSQSSRTQGFSYCFCLVR